ncbi:MAG: PAS domain S-box protein [Deltaproteobacteria bacterium]|nr:PAS domain S-box protein [Deltaproteobacteria bacterium]
MEKTDRRRASDEQVRVIIENALDAVVVMNSNGLITSWNPQAEKIFGWTKEEAIGRRMSETIIPPHYREAHERGLKHFLKTGEGPALNKRLELTAIHRSGREFPVELTVSPTKLGETWIFSAFIRDITERKKAEEDLKKTNEELWRLNENRAAFTSIVSHELRTPLQSIKEGIDIVLDGIDGPVTGRQKETLGISKSNVDRLARLIDNVLDYSKYEAGKMKMELMKADLNKLVEEVYRLMKLEVGRKGVDFFIELPAEPVFAVVDGDKIKQVLINLVHNAVKFTEEGKISVRLSQARDAVLLEVEDTGSGIRKEDQPAVFDMYGQAPGTQVFRAGGSGIGLAVCKLIIDQHGGQIGIESAPRKGTKFTITLPQPFNAAQG